MSCASGKGRYAQLYGSMPGYQSGFSQPPVTISRHYAPIYSYGTPCSQTNYYSSCQSCPTRKPSPNQAYDVNDDYPQCMCKQSATGTTTRMNTECKTCGSVKEDSGEDNKEHFSNYVYYDSKQGKPCGQRPFSSGSTMKVPARSCAQGSCGCSKGPNQYSCNKYQSAFPDCAAGCGNNYVGYCSISKPANFGGSYGKEKCGVPRGIEGQQCTGCQGGCATQGCSRFFM